MADLKNIDKKDTFQISSFTEADFVPPPLPGIAESQEDHLQYHKVVTEHKQPKSYLMIVYIVGILVVIAVIIVLFVFSMYNRKQNDTAKADVKQEYIENGYRPIEDDSELEEGEVRIIDEYGQKYAAIQKDFDDKDDSPSQITESIPETQEEPQSEYPTYSEDVPPDDLYDWSSSILPFSSDRLLTYDDISYLSREQLILARNEIYARHGRIFKVDWIREYFEAQPWYYGTLTEEEFSSDLFSDIEMKNIMFIKEYESMLDG